MIDNKSITRLREQAMETRDALVRDYGWSPHVVGLALKVVDALQALEEEANIIAHEQRRLRPGEGVRP